MIKRWLTGTALLAVAAAAPLACGDDDNIDNGEVDGGGGGVIVPNPDSGSTTLGASCTSDADCGAATTCLTADDGQLDGQGPAGGLCTAECTSDADCAALQSGSLRVPLADQLFYCVEPCTMGGFQECHQRNDMACAAVSEGGPAVCFPLCNGDPQCPDGMFCDHDTLLCSDSPDPGTEPLDAPCDLNASTDECEDGFCADAGDGTGICSQLCTLGSPLQCGWDSEASPTLAEPAQCLTFEQGAGPSDLGTCFTTCDEPSECVHPDMTCVDTTAAEGKTGVCFFEEPTDGGTGGAAGSPGTGGTGGTGGVGGEAGGGS